MPSINITKKKDYAILQLNRGKVNAINMQLVQEVRAALANFKEDDSIRGVIITGQPHYYSAGLDVVELYGMDKETIAPFFTAFGEMYIDLAKFPKPLIAAITGHAPAGGCVIAMTADYRVMADKEIYKIGLNEVLVNVPLSEDLIRGYAFWLGDGLSTRYLMQGRMMSPQEGKSIGFIDEVCPLEEVVARAEKQMQNYLRANDAIIQGIKYNARKDWLNKIGHNGEENLKITMDIWWRPEVRSRMKGFVELLTAKRK